MPFTSTTQLPDYPDVRVFFTGLLVIDPNPKAEAGSEANPFEKTCEVFVHRSAPDHRLTIEVRRKQAGRPDIIMMRHIGQLDFLPPGEEGETPRLGMRIEVNSNPKGVSRYDPAGPEDVSPEGEGLGLAIDLDRLPSQEKSVGEINPQAGRPSILFNDGVFYTAAKTREDLKVGLVKDGVLVVQTLPPFASVIGANIYLDEGEVEGEGSSVLVRWVQQGLPHVLQLEKPKPEEKEKGLSYEIYIVNEPLFESEDSLLPRHDELKEYFKILPDAEEQFALLSPQQDEATGTGSSERGSTTTPCMPVIKGGSTA
jgi:hypothetical protein